MRLTPASSVSPQVDLPNASSPTSSSCSIDESYKYVFLPVCYSLTFVFSLTLNSVVLLRSCRLHGVGAGGGRRWNTSLIYMVNLATTDLMYGLSLPFLVASYVLRDRWVFGDFMCRLVRFLFYFNLYCSIFFLTCISVHRYLGICHPMRTITLESKRVVKGTCALVWVVVFILTCPIFRFAQTGLVMRGGGGAVVSPGGVKDGGNWTGDQDREGYMNCWDDAIDKEFADYVPYGIVLHLLGFFVPFVIIAWCYSQVVRTIFQTLRSPPSSVESGEDGPVGDGAAEGVRERERTSVSISGSQYSHYIRRRRKSIKTIVTITLLFALCFLPFHVTRTLFLLLRRGQLGGCNAMKAVSICYKVTRPLASCNAWLNALLYFLTGDKGAPCCCPAGRSVRRDRRSGSLWWPLKILKKEGVGDDDQEVAEKVEREAHIENESKSSRVIF
ncbi:P2Y purinoceptor 3 [Amphiprion ocellaris]|uniref:G-protein coupled receptors family 1 profile domain-containing protein n=1 Tax=Amphiprion ocellaris TaxID=80972 RepID=A0A3Q1C0E9_AMPOC|nr:P2Y purinoceptor 3 [Amphiprion ocellaris]XP_054873000.1 P2Y purinoceptor 3 [Amphiprion ocellaris]